MPGSAVSAATVVSTSLSGVEPDGARRHRLRRVRSAFARAPASSRAQSNPPAPIAKRASHPGTGEARRNLRHRRAPRQTHSPGGRPSSRAARTEICWPTIARTASSKPSNVPGTRRPGRASASVPSAAATSAGSQERSKACFTRDSTGGDRARERRRYRDAERRTSRRAPHLDPADVPRSAMLDRDRPRVERPRPPARRRRWRGSPGTKASRPSRRADGTRARTRARPGAPGAARLAQPPRRHPVTRLEQRVEAAHAREAAGARDLRDGQRGIRQQPLGEQEALRLRILDRRHAEFRFEDPPQVPARDSDARREVLDAAGLEHAVFDEIDGALREPGDGIHARVAGSELRPATQAWPIAFDFRRGSAREEPAILPARQAHRAHRAAIDARRRNADEESAVEARIVRRERAVAGVGIERHGTDYASRRHRRLAVFRTSHPAPPTARSCA